VEGVTHFGPLALFGGMSLAGARNDVIPDRGGRPVKKWKGGDGVACEDFGPTAASVAAWFSLRAHDRGAAAVALHALRRRAARIVAGRCRCDIAVAEDHVADGVFVMVYGIRRAPQLRISATTTLAYLCGVARNEWRWDRWRRAREAGVEGRRALRTVIDV